MFKPIPKITAVFAATLFALLLAIPGYCPAQENDDPEAKARRAEMRKQMREQMRKMRESKTMQKMQRQMGKNISKSFWNGNGGIMMIQGLVHDEDARKGMGISEEQRTQLQNSMGAVFQDPKMQEIQKKMGELQGGNPEDPFLDDAPPEKQQEFIKLQSDMMELMLEKQAAAIESTITPEQKRKVQEMQIATMGDFPIVSPSMFEALDLTDPQREQLDQIKKELEPDFEKNMERMMDSQMKLMEKIGEYQDREDVDLDWTNPEEASKKMEEIQKKVLAENPDLQKEFSEMLDEGTAFTNRLKFQMFDVLTDEQMDRMSALINDPPEFIKKLRDKMREQTRKMRNTSGGQLDINAWKPGDPIPEEYLEQRKSKRFPKK